MKLKKIFLGLLLMTAFLTFSQDRYCFTRKQAERLAVIKRDYIRLLDLASEQDKELKDTAIDLKIANYVITQQDKELTMCKETNTLLSKKNENLEVVMRKQKCTFWKKLGIGTAGAVIGAGLYAIFQDSVKSLLK